MTVKQEFYFVRHGQTDHNISEGNLKGDHAADIALNETGKNQAKNIEPTIASLPIRTVCSSPMRRAQETKEIITAKLQATHYEVEHLGECSSLVWKEMSKAGMYASFPLEGPARLFLERVQEGINRALSLPGPLLVVAHGGVHWVLCALLGIKNHKWAIGNCDIVHFSVGNNEKWVARKL